MEPATDNGIVNLTGNHSVDETVERLKGILRAKGVTLFAIIDHSGEAEKAGLKCPLPNYWSSAIQRPGRR